MAADREEDRARLLGGMSNYPEADLRVGPAPAWRPLARFLVLGAGGVALILIAALTIVAVEDFDTVLLGTARTALYAEGILYAVVALGPTWILLRALDD